MKLYKLEVTNFKAFRDFQLDIEGRHLLIHGANGAGKSSLYWALYTFLQSANKPKDSIAKYFDPESDEKLLNIYEQKEIKPREGEISLTLRDNENKKDITYRISQKIHGTYNDPIISKGHLASDFITYRFFFGFSHFRNSERFNLWPLFEKEILPFCVSTSGQSPYAMWQEIRDGKPNRKGARGAAGKNAYKQFAEDTENFATVLNRVVEEISEEAISFYRKHFSEGDLTPIDFKLAVTTKPSFSGTQISDSSFIVPEIGFGVSVNGQEVKRPQSFLNEAKLTQLALSIRFAASLVNLHESELKLLVLDDLLVSLDMSNRMKVVDIILSETFSSYQKIILTHDLGFSREFRRRIGQNNPSWNFLNLRGNAANKIEAQNEKNNLEKAEDYLRGHHLEEAAIFLRRAAEDIASHRLEQITGKPLLDDKFSSLTNNLREIRNKLEKDLSLSIYKNVLSNVPIEHRDFLISSNDTDLDSHAELSPAEKGKIISKRKKLKAEFIKNTWGNVASIEMIECAIHTTERVLNPASHSNIAPLYEEEVRRAKEIIAELDKVLADCTDKTKK